MTDEAIAVLTAKSADAILTTGGTQSWVLDRGRAKRCAYVLVCQNAHTDWGDGKEPHGKGFMVGRVDDVIPSTDARDRWLVAFSAYASIDKLDAWGGWRNPVRYTTLSDLGIDASKLRFKPMPPRPDRTALAHVDKTARGMTIAQAKKGLALTFGVDPEAVEITIRG